MLKCVIIGCGNIAGGYDSRSSAETVMTHAKAFRMNPGTQLVGAFDPSNERASAFGTQWGIPATYTDLRKMMAECAPDVVSICSPNATHFETFKTVAEFKPRAVICEKPLALKLDQAREMIDQAKREKLLLVVNYQRRWDSALTALGRRIVGGEFGDLRLARVIYTKGLFHNASHMINLLQAWAGEYRTASVHKVLDRKDGDVVAHFKLEFERCPDAFFQAVDASDFNTAEIDLHFAKARIRLPGAGSEIHIQQAEPSALIPGERALSPRTEVIPGTLHRALKEVVDNVVDTLSGKDKLVMPSEEALHTLEICEEIRKQTHG